MTRLPLILPLALAAACTPVTGDAPPATAAPDPIPGTRCDANVLAGLVGKPAASISDEAKRLSGARTVRSYGPNDPVTMDYRPDRLNIETDAKGVVVRFTCG